MAKQEKIQVTVPANNAWHSDDLDAKAEKMGMSRSEYALLAVDMLYNVDQDILAEVERYARGLHLPTWLVMQNMIIDQLTEYKVLAAQGTPKTMLEFQAHVDDNGVPHTLTGKQLYDWLLDHKTRTVQRERDQRDNPLHL